jgi:hypothetical protein
MDILMQCLQIACLLALACGLYLQLRFLEGADEQVLTRRLLDIRYAGSALPADDRLEVPAPAVAAALPDR